MVSMRRLVLNDFFYDLRCLFYDFKFFFDFYIYLIVYQKKLKFIFFFRILYIVIYSIYVFLLIEILIKNLIDFYFGKII